MEDLFLLASLNFFVEIGENCAEYTLKKRDGNITDYMYTSANR